MTKASALPRPIRARFAAHNDTARLFGCPDVDATFGLPFRVTLLEKLMSTFYKMRRLWLSSSQGRNRFK